MIYFVLKQFWEIQELFCECVWVGLPPPHSGQWRSQGNLDNLRRGIHWAGWACPLKFHLNGRIIKSYIPSSYLEPVLCNAVMSVSTLVCLPHSPRHWNSPIRQFPTRYFVFAQNRWEFFGGGDVDMAQVNVPRIPWRPLSPCTLFIFTCQKYRRAPILGPWLRHWMEAREGNLIGNFLAVPLLTGFIWVLTHTGRI